MAMNPAPTPTRSRKPGVVVLLVGLAVLVGSVVLIAVRVGPGLVDALGGSDRVTPFQATMNLDAQTYVVYELVGTGSVGNGVSVRDRRPPSVTMSDVSVTDAQGAPIPVRAPSFAQELTVNTKFYEGVAQFDVPNAGDYTITVSGPDGATVMVAPSLGSTFSRAIPGLLLGVLGLLVVLGGFILVIVGVKRGGTPVVAASPLPAAGWYPDPERPGAQRWWDGERWR